MADAERNEDPIVKEAIDNVLGTGNDGNEAENETENDEPKEKKKEIEKVGDVEDNEIENISEEEDENVEDLPAEKPEEGDEDEDTFSLISSEDTEEQKEKYQEYLNVLKEIKQQNQIIANYKEEIKEIAAKDIPKKCRKAEMDLLMECLEIERDQLDCLVVKAMQLQNFGSRRRYKFIKIETMPEEEL